MTIYLRVAVGSALRGVARFGCFGLLVNDGEWLRAGANIGGSVVCCPVAV